MRISKIFGMFLFAVSLGLGAGGAQASVIEGRVIAIADGDTLVILTDENRQVRVRLNEIDAPESDQPWGLQAKKALSELAMSRYVRVVDDGLDDYGRTLGRVYFDSMDINAEMVRRGDAWAYRHYLVDRSLLTDEAEAKRAKRGLWSMSPSEIMPPWDWRNTPGARQRIAARPRGNVTVETRPYPRASTNPNAGFTCGAKRYCREMTSCEEARFYLKVCHANMIDGDHDGVPCEAICSGG